MRLGVHLVTFGAPRGPAGFLAEMRELAAAGIDEVHVVPLGDAATDPVGPPELIDL
jgi:hypothetical protein